MRFLDSLPANILLVDDDPVVIQVLGKALAELGRLRFAIHGEQALNLCRQTVPDLVLLDAEMPGMSGFEVLQAMKADPSLAEVPVIFVTSHSQQAMEERGLALGAVDFIPKPIRPAIVAARVRTQLRLKQAIDRLQRLASTDGLTGVANRRVLDEALDREWRRARRGPYPLSLLMMDIDHFKRYNDSCGHLMGDRCLVTVAHALQASVGRPSDLVARYGGEEFAVLLPDTDAVGAQYLARQILERLQQLAIEHPAAELGRISGSIGVASFDAQSPGWSQPISDSAALDLSLNAQGAMHMLATADKALYQAKQAGRAQAVFSQVDGRCGDAVLALHTARER
jgi:diguanylate cyclase (GGDEF)-like protein